jgi:endonuclease/exonuclease/phosphatase family metal-dependent hydrolase
VLRANRPDVIALQEIDRVEHAEYLGRELGMEMFFVAAREHGGGLSYGNALLTSLPAGLVRADKLPQLHADTEARAAQWIRVQAPFGAVDIVNTHLGLRKDERLLQVDTLLGPEWFGDSKVGRHAVLCGDLNARPGTLSYTRLCNGLVDAQMRFRRPKPTFPAIFPVVRIDHVLSTPSLMARGVDVPSGAGARWASDHRPLVAELALSEAAA